MNLSITELKNTGCFSDTDIHLADFLSFIGKEGSPVFYLAVLMLSSRLNSGDVCISLDDIAGKPLSYFFGDDGTGTYDGIVIPSKDQLAAALNKSSAVGNSDSYLPLILDTQGRLYFQKYHSFENSLADSIKKLAGDKKQHVDISNVKDSFLRLFGTKPGVTDWQSIAAYSALSGGITVITGGPGTGKTSTVVKILALIAENSVKNGREVLISMAAPTGKAAARLREAVTAALDVLPVSDNVKRMIPSETFTVHRLLGPIRDSREFRHNSRNPLVHDVVVVDECSMCDMALMCRLVSAVKPGAQLILLGDRDQLSSVEGGAVFADLCGYTGSFYSKNFITKAKEIFGLDIPADGGEREGAALLNDALVVLKKSYRFSGQSGIGILSEMIKKGDAHGAIEILNDGAYPDVYFACGNSARVVGEEYREHASGILSGIGTSAEDRIRLLINSLVILTATRSGIYGAERMNSVAEGVLYNIGVIDPAEKFYRGRPVMISRNDYSLSLFNGDIGITSSDGAAKVVFPATDGEERIVHPSRLPEHETAFSMTIHKSQGSEFDRVLIVLPDRWNMVMTRELLYTAVTRAKNGIVISASEDIVREMISTPTKRMSGLKQKLWGSI